MILTVLKTLGWVLGIFAALQLIPYGRTHANPPITQEPQWDSPRTRELAVRACFDCHSNETHWPWYADVAPFSWVVQTDVENARDVINFSTWNRTYDLAPYSSQSIVTGSMPPQKYRMAHPAANLTKQELLDLVHGLDVTLKAPTRAATP